MTNSDHYELSGFAIPEGLEELRVMLQDVSAGHPGIDPMSFMLFETAVTEIANNVIEHAGPRGEVRWRFDLDVSRDLLAATLTDSGAAFTGSLTEDMPDPLAEGGRGLALARAILDDLRYERTENGNVWRMERGTAR